MFDFCGSLFHLIAFMIAQDWYFFTDISTKCTFDDFGLVRDWMLLEISIFYASIFSTVIFMLISKVFLKNSGLMYLEKEDTDFLNRYNTMNGFFSTFFLTQMCCIVLAYKFYSSYQDPASKDVIWPTDHGLYLFLLQIAMIIAHASQFTAVNL